LWNRTTLFLIEKIEEAEKQFAKSVKKNVWVKIAQLCTKEINRNFTCIIKQQGRTEDKFMYKRPEISPFATCGNRKGLECIEEDTVESFSSNVDGENEVSEGCSGETKTTEFESWFTKKRKGRMCGVEIRHQEKMARQDRLNDLFEKMIEKL
jgi:hypothetical protein